MKFVINIFILFTNLIHQIMFQRNQECVSLSQLCHFLKIRMQHFLYSFICQIVRYNYQFLILQLSNVRKDINNSKQTSFEYRGLTIDNFEIFSFILLLITNVNFTRNFGIWKKFDNYYLN